NLPYAIEQLLELVALADAQLVGAERIGSDEDRQPAAGPAERRVGLLHPTEALGQARVVVGSYGSRQIVLERHGREELDPLHVFGIDPAGDREGVAHARQ